jgi:hypothetical protein
MENVRQAILKIGEIHSQWNEDEKAKAAEKLSRIGRVDAELDADEAYHDLPRAERRTIRQARLREAGLLPDQQDTRAKYSRRTGKVTLYFGGIERGFQPCPHCGATAGMGFIGVTHDDGRGLSFDPLLYHYAQAGHPIAAEDVDAGLLLAIMADAE